MPITGYDRASCACGRHVHTGPAFSPAPAVAQPAVGAGVPLVVQEEPSCAGSCDVVVLKLRLGSPGDDRRAARTALRRLGVPHDLVERALLVISELLLHSGALSASFELHLHQGRTGRELRVGVAGVGG
ncbi:hypothetical protein ACGFT2_23990 [Streptomyces sp. NPDC048514]|uniref:hypothetical protein n=1 Tax=Streptomyces sp. NPDC048514 TaxID=3365564 RepID=UPI003720AE87